MNEPSRPPFVTKPAALTNFDQRVVTALADRYRVQHVLGRGGMAVVYTADDSKHARRVAIKILDPNVSSALGPERFLREIRLAASLQHPNILPVVDSGEAGDLLYYAMPLVEGPSLRARLEKEGQLAIDEAIRITTQVASALDYAHEHGIVHRDIKPENILLDGDRAVVADFGIAKSLDAVGETLTSTGVSVGTPAYMSPEQCTGERHVDGRTDTYSLACVLYELLAGEPPFTGVNAQSVIAKRFAGPPPSLRVLRDTVPIGVDRAVARALARAPADRFTTSGEFARSLEANAKPDSERPRLSRGILLAAGTLVVAAIGAGFWTTRPASVSPAAKRDSVVVSLVARASQSLDRRTTDGVQRALQLSQQAIARDSDYADAWAALARTLQFASSWGYPIPGLEPDSIVPLMVRAGNRAVELDSNSVRAWVAKSQVLRIVNPIDLRPRFEIIGRALKLDSNSVEAWFQQGNLWQDSLELHRAIAAYRRAATIRPTHSNSLAFMSFVYCWLRQPDSALVWADSAAKVDPDNVFAQQAIAFARRGRGEWEAARPAYDAVVKIGNGPDQTFGYAGLAELAWRRGDRSTAYDLLRRAVANVDTLKPQVHDAAYLAWGYGQTNQRERAIRLLERFEPRLDTHFQLHLLREPMLDTLRSMPRFQALLRRRESSR